MEFLKLLKLALRAFMNWMFRSEVVTAKNQDPNGFNIYEYEGVPSVTPGFFIVKFRHVVNGEERTKRRIRMTDREWASTRSRLLESTEQEAV
ncbi:hypothetical protein [Ralstonia pseudosolanacearum]|uniref:hypothetical protein n=1 Tax=Ralstonia pseudosolanacearum TaxID=1310165 RepID=UPI003CFA3489